MSFRRNSDRPLAWKRWVGLHRDELTSAGVPAEILSDELRWWRFLEEGGLDWNTGWRVEMLSPQQAATLHRLITTEFRRSDVACCLRSLAEVIRSQDERP
jgi:hypothetical protein